MLSEFGDRHLSYPYYPPPFHASDLTFLPNKAMRSRNVGRSIPSQVTHKFRTNSPVRAAMPYALSQPHFRLPQRAFSRKFILKPYFKQQNKKTLLKSILSVMPAYWNGAIEPCTKINDIEGELQIKSE